jgi:hypothetical protein
MQPIKCVSFGCWTLRVRPRAVTTELISHILKLLVFGIPKSDSDVTDCVVHWHFLMESVFRLPKSDSDITDCGVHWHFLMELVFRLPKSDALSDRVSVQASQVQLSCHRFYSAH